VGEISERRGQVIGTFEGIRRTFIILIAHKNMSLAGK
jgi:hypothetical protein